MPKQNKRMSRNTHKSKLTQIPFCVPIFLDMRPTLERDQCTQWHSIREAWFSLSQQVSTSKSLMAKGGTLCPFPFFLPGFCLVWTCAVHRLWVYMCISPVVTEDAVFSKSSMIPGYNLSASSSVLTSGTWEKGFYKHLLFLHECSNSLSVFTQCPLVGLCVC